MSSPLNGAFLSRLQDLAIDSMYAHAYGFFGLMSDHGISISQLLEDERYLWQLHKELSWECAPLLLWAVELFVNDPDENDEFTLELFTQLYSDVFV